MNGYLKLRFSPKSVGLKVKECSLADVPESEGLARTKQVIAKSKLSFMEGAMNANHFGFAKLDGDSVIACTDLNIDPRIMDFSCRYDLKEIEPIGVNLTCWIEVSDMTKIANLGYKKMGEKFGVSVIYDPTKDDRPRIKIEILGGSLLQVKDALFEILAGKFEPDVPINY